jgi:hypothetical protein
MNRINQHLRRSTRAPLALLLLAAAGTAAQTPSTVPASPAQSANAPPAAAAPSTSSSTPPAPSSSALPPAPSSSALPPAAEALAALDWLQGCWRGAVNQREFREEWLPPGGGMMIGAGHTVLQGRTQDYEYLRIEARPDGLYYVALPSGQKEASFRLSGVAHDDVDNADIWTFSNVVEGYPQRIVYRRGGEGWLYAGIEGTLNGEQRKVLYPMRHVNCETGEVIHK